MLSHIYQVSAFQKWVFVFFGVLFLLVLKDEDPQNARSGRRGKEKWLSFRFIDILEILHVSCDLELSPSDFDFDFRWGFVDNRKAWSNSLTNTTIFFSLVRLRSRQPFRDVFRTGFCGELPEHLVLAVLQTNPYSFQVTSREVILSRKSDLTCL